MSTRLWKIEQYNYVNGELINVLNVPLGVCRCSIAVSAMSLPLPSTHLYSLCRLAR